MSTATGAAAPLAMEKQEEAPRRWNFSLLPKAFQTNPMMDMTVITEMTDEGRLRPLPSPASPAYYSLLSAGYRMHGEISGDLRIFSQAETEEHLIRALAASGFQPEKEDHPPSLLIVYSWGVHSPLEFGDEENPAEANAAILRNMLARAALVGGDGFARELHARFMDASDMFDINRIPGFETLPPWAFNFANPIAQFRQSSVRNEFLLLQSANSLYYIIASAYDYSSAAENRRVLLWRTRMTVSAAGVSQRESLPTVIQTAAPYFGRETAEPQIVQRRVKDGTTSIGELRVLPSEGEPEGSIPNGASK